MVVSIHFSVSLATTAFSQLRAFTNISITKQFIPEGQLRGHLARRKPDGRESGLMTNIYEFELGPPSHLAFSDLGSEYKRCVRLPTPGSCYLPRRGMFLSSVLAKHENILTDTYTHRNTLNEE